MAKYNIGDAGLRIVPDLSGFKTELESRLKAIKGSVDVALQAKTDKFLSEVEAARELAGEKIDVDLDLDTAKARGKYDAFVDRIKAQGDIKKNVDVDTTAAAARMASWRAREEAQVVRQKVVVDRDSLAASRGGGGGGGAPSPGDEDFNMRVVQNFYGTTLFDIANITTAASAIAGVVAALSGVVAAAAAAGTALGAMGAVIGVGGSGIIGAFTAMKAQSDAAGTSGVDSARQQREALQAVEDAADNVRRSQEQYEDSLRDAADAAEDSRNAQDELRDAQDELNDSWAEGRQELRDLNEELVDSGQSRERAAISLARAKEKALETQADFRAGKASGLDVQDANLGVREAESRLRQAQAKFGDKRTEVQSANDAGVAGTNAVTSAQDAVEVAQERAVAAARRQDDAQKQVANSAVALARAQRELADAQADLANGSGAASSAQDKLDQALAKLSPNARDFVTQVRALGGAWTTLRLAVQDALFENMGTAFSNFATRHLPALQTGMVALAGTMNTVLRDTMGRVSATFSEFTANGTFDAFISGVQQSFSGFAPVVDSVVRALTHLTVAIGPQLGPMFEQMAGFINSTTPMFASFGAKTTEGIGQSFPILSQMLRDLQPAVEAFMPFLLEAFRKFGEIIGSQKGDIAVFAQNLGETLVHAVDVFGGVLNALMPMLNPLLDAFQATPSGLIAGLLTAAVAGRSLLNPLLSVANNVGRIQAMAQNFKTLGTYIGGIGSAFNNWAVNAALAQNRTGRALSSIGNAAGAAASTVASKARVAGEAIASAMADGGRKGAQGARTAMQNIGTAVASSGGAISKAASSSWTWLAALPGTIGKSTAAMKLTSAATKVWAIAQGALNAVMLMNPVYLFVAAIVAVVAAIVLAYTKCETFRNIVNAIGAVLVDVGKFAFNAIKEHLYNFVDLVKSAGQVFEGIGKVFSGVWDFIVSAAKAAIGLLTGNFEAAKNGVRGMGDAFKAVADGIKTAFKGIGNILLIPVRGLGRILKAFPEKLGPISIPGSGSIRNFGNTLSNVRLRNGGEVPGRPGGLLVGPGTSTSDSILGIDRASGMPTAWVSNQEFVVNAKSTAKHRNLIEAINDDSPILSKIPKRADGGLAGLMMPGTEDPKKKKGNNVTPDSLFGALTGPVSPAPGATGDPMMDGLAEIDNRRNPPPAADVGPWAWDDPASPYYQEPDWGAEGDDWAIESGFGGEYPGAYADTASFGAFDQSNPGTLSGAALDRAMSYARSHEGEPYVYAGLDCSMFMSGIFASLTGRDPGTRWFTTESDFESLGFVPGLSDGFQIGIMRGGGGPNSHMAGTLNGVPVESASGKGIVVGTNSQGALDPMFSLHFTLPFDSWNPPATKSDPYADGSGGGGGGGGDGYYGNDYESYAADGGTSGMVNPDGTISDGAVEVDQYGNNISDVREKLNVPSMFGKAGEIMGSWFLDSLGLGNSIFSGGNVYNKANQDVYDFYHPSDKEKAKNAKARSNTPSVGNGDPDSEAMKLLMDGNDLPSDFGGTDDYLSTPSPGGVKGAVSKAFDEVVGGWGSGRQWDAVDWIVGKESSWNPEARNPSSGAFGLFQFLGSTKDQYLPDENVDPYVQGLAGAAYMRDRYGDPTGARKFWEQHNWYESGGWLMPGATMALNGTGQPEAILNAGQWDAISTLAAGVASFMGRGEIASMLGAGPSAMQLAKPAVGALRPAGVSSVSNDSGINIGAVNTLNVQALARELSSLLAQRDMGQLSSFPMR